MLRTDRGGLAARRGGCDSVAMVQAGSAAKATITDVARAAGVSIKSVSRVLNNERYVGAATRAKIQAAVAALNYRPNLAARAMAGRRSFQIALVCDNPSAHYVYAMQQGVRDRCEADGVRMIAQPYDRGSDRLIADLDALIATSHLDGLILTPPLSDHDGVLAMLAARGVRFVRVSPGDDRALAPAVFIDNRAASAAMVAHLAARGHRRIAHIAGHPDYAASGQRVAGFRDGLATAGIGFDAELVARGDYDFARSAAAAAALLALSPPPTAIFAASDEMAAAALATAHARGLAIPADVAIAGFGDDAIAGYVWPPLTTVRQPLRELAWTAADLLLRESAATERRELAFALVERQST